MRGLAAARVWLAAAAAAAAGGCAAMGAPPGGPEDHEPPQVVNVSPDSGAINFRGRVVQFRFDEVISERGPGSGGLDQLVLVSPRDGSPRVAWRREAIAVRPRSGWRPNTAYSVMLLPGITDLRGNTTKEGRKVIFSTGATLPQFALRGRVFDWMAERPAARAWVEAISRPDSIVYIAVADSLGAFTVAPLTAGAYTVRAFIDQNGNRALDRGEAWDSVAARPSRAGVETTIELLAALRDTLPPRISGVATSDSVTVALEFDRPLDPRQQVTPAMFDVARTDSSRVLVREALTRGDFDRRAAARQAALDTGRAARLVPGQPQLVRAATEIRPSLPPPPTRVVLRVGTPLTPGASYRVTAIGVRNLLGRPGTSSRVIQVPHRAAADTTRRPP